MLDASGVNRANSWIGALSAFAIIGVLLFAIILVKVPFSPRYVGLGDDAALFAYAGQEILDGGVLYQDVWDTKPPGVFYLNALAILLGGPAPWSVWWFELVWFSISILLLLFILYKVFGFFPALASTVLVVFTALHPTLTRGGNFTELYALLPQTLTLGALIAFFNSRRIIWLILAGALTAAAFVLKPTTIAIGLAGLVVALMPLIRSSNWRSVLQSLGAFSAGFVLPLIFAAAYWISEAVFGELLDAVLGGNLQYVQEGLSLRSLYGTSRKLLLEQPVATVFVLTLAALVLAAERFRLQGLNQWSLSLRIPIGHSVPVRNGVLLTVFLALPLELVFVALSGRNFGHYFLTPLPAMAVAIAFLFRELRSSHSHIREIGPWYYVSLLFLAGVLAAWSLEIFSAERPRTTHLEDLLKGSLGGEFWIDEVESYVASTTDPDDPVLVWGYNPGLHIAAGRKSPTRYFFHAQLLAPGPAGSARFDQFMLEVKADPPALILAQRESQHAVPFFGNEDSDLCPDCSEDARQNLRKVRSFVEEQYELREDIDGWLIYGSKE